MTKMQILNHENFIMFVPDDEGGYTLESNDITEGRLRKTSDGFEYESEEAKGNWIPCGKSISEARDFIFSLD